MDRDRLARPRAARLRVVLQDLPRGGNENPVRDRSPDRFNQSPAPAGMRGADSHPTGVAMQRYDEMYEDDDKRHEAIARQCLLPDHKQLAAATAAPSHRRRITYARMRKAKRKTPVGGINRRRDKHWNW